MRILVTKNGTVYFQDMDDIPTLNKNGFSNSGSNLFSNKIKTVTSFTKKLGHNKTLAKSINKSNISIPYNNKLIKKRHKTVTNIQNDLDENEFSKEEIKNAKHVKLGRMKISFPKNFAEKYDSTYNIDDTKGNSSVKLPTLQNKNILDENNTSKNRLYCFKDIIPNKSIVEMQKKIIKDKRMRDKLSVITTNDFRTEYMNENNINKFNNMLLSPKISSTKSSLIKYLTEKKMDPLALESLYKRDGPKISRINKMCQILFHKEEHEKVFNEIIKDKLKHILNNEKKTFQNKINILENDINIIKNKLEKYDHKVDPKEKYRDQFNDVLLHHWLKHDYERLNKKSSPKCKYLRNYYDNGNDNEV